MPSFISRLTSYLITVTWPISDWTGFMVIYLFVSVRDRTSGSLSPEAVGVGADMLLFPGVMALDALNLLSKSLSSSLNSC